ncbi:hypothetical protein M2459_001965 [Parabacteroides sp. PF5-5]|uniref:ATP-binding protein n=1 Tax=unclassified Parabacteroides TaxID=2649774 RepID=UPI002474CE3E|nr:MULTISPECIES: ATP-binding protein [unclassified Parabacteroides]MDH6306731.1 hypothetical protein [Parabacteroides sp. PH5-39]MDH6316222.1 hypothetical protein [Parabacteroides sp. PF5-13]MDH6321417.1 hypothetical protein [Parabacteroides sp. PH5-13]MDH6325148.1 hypothetical protein [Parabacteroides sp. PH5-8]MDH6327413.1 hypothetical protein [Parabacteroides sp. PH5-41]
MRYLNKIIFINSASVKYSEISLDGNVHFIGTQGVGKSTLLRAILFFYNADKLKLGISREKKNFDEYYFPYINSYIIYEVEKETEAYCVLAYKQQGRVCFRFFDTVYDKKHFIDSSGQVFGSWDYIRESLGKNIRSTRKIDRYEEYKDILYGNNAGLRSEFKKYALLESKNYQNVPRTIQNVFLNSKLDAEFIKQTIIKSLNEEDVEVDLTNYANHLKDFEAKLNDIGKWSDKNAKGEIIIRKQAERITNALSSIRFLEHEMTELTAEFNFAWEGAVIMLPKEMKKQESEIERKQTVEKKESVVDARFQSKKDKLNGEISVLANKLEDIKEKEKYYKGLNITEILRRVSQKGTQEKNKQNLEEEQRLLTSKFEEVNQKYEAIFKQFENQKNDFNNIRNKEKISIKADFLKFKEDLAGQYEVYFDEIRKKYQQELDAAQDLLEEKGRNIQDLRVKEAETKHKPFLLSEINTCKQEADKWKEKIRLAENIRTKAEGEIGTLQKQWELETKSCHLEYDASKEKVEEKLEKLNRKISAIDKKLEDCKDSFYEWLNKEYPEWENTIGKVIDEDILFHGGLSPQKVQGADLEFYGIRLDLSEIEREVKTVSDYEVEKDNLKQEIAANKTLQNELNKTQLINLEKIKQKYNPKIRTLKETINTNKILVEQGKLKQEESEIKLVDWQRKAEEEKATALQQLTLAINQLIEEKRKSEENLRKIKEDIEKKLDKKHKEKTKKIQEEEDAVRQKTKCIEEAIRQNESVFQTKFTEAKAKQQSDLLGKGVDTKRLATIDMSLAQIGEELKYIEENRDTVSDYQKDKRELFDKTDDFNTKKQLLESQLQTEADKYKLQKEKIKHEITEIDDLIALLGKNIEKLQTDLQNVENFKLTDCWTFVEGQTKQEKTDKNCSELINFMYVNNNTTIKRYEDLKESINRFLGNFKEDNIFNFKTHLIESEEFVRFAEELQEFIEEDKIETFKQRVNQLYTDIIRQIGKETTELISRSGDIQRIIKNINDDFVERIFTGVIKSIELRVVDSGNKVVQWMMQIKKFNDEHSFEIGEDNLFSSSNRESLNRKSVELLKLLVREIGIYKEDKITLSDSFELQFKIVENDNDSGWVEKLSNVGSDGTDVLVKAMINIMLLNVFKEHASKRFNDFKLHCMMDEIGKLHPTNIKGILDFANSRNILLINSSPTSYNATDYKYTYKLGKDTRSVTTVHRLIKKIS